MIHKYGTLIYEIKDLINLDSNISITHTLHKGNSCVDFMTKTKASSSLDFMIYTSPPTDLSIILAIDCAGTWFHIV